MGKKKKKQKTRQTEPRTDYSTGLGNGESECLSIRVSVSALGFRMGIFHFLFGILFLHLYFRLFSLFPFSGMIPFRPFGLWLCTVEVCRY